MWGNQVKRIHCIGIGGIGVSALAGLLLEKGYLVSGSDLNENKNTERLKNLGVNIMIGHAPENIKKVDKVIYSSAISVDNPELSTAKAAGIPLLQRGEALAEFMDCYDGIAISGTHGKTTTSGLASYLLLTAGLDPSFLVGGLLQDKNRPSQLGSGRYFVAEADESDASFLYMHPKFAVVTNIDADHLETYDGDFEVLKNSFLSFLQAIPEDGAAIVCIDDPVVRSLLPRINCRYITYGFDEDADFQINNYHQKGLTSTFSVKRQNDLPTLSLQFTLPGKHNALNATAAVVVGTLLKIEDAQLQKGIATFPGVGRRFHYHGEMPVSDGLALVIEDYGHHPNEIKATLAAAKLAWPDRRVVLVFQPHRYSRTRDLYQEFCSVLSDASQLILLDIYTAGEAPIEGISAENLFNDVMLKSKNKPIFVEDLKHLPEMLKKHCRRDDVVIFQGAGNVGSFAKELTEDL
jgi:UDP-N-acetylmuramate--alanine ligase